MAPALRHAVAVFAALSLFDVLLNAAWWSVMVVAPTTATIHLADLMPLVIAWTLVPAMAIGAFGAGLARRLVKPDVESGESRWIDLLARPAAAAAVFALAGAAFGLSDGADVGEIPGILGVLFVAGLIAASAAGLVVRLVRWRTLVVAATAVVVVALMALAVADRRGRGRLEELRAEALREAATVGAARQAALRPLLHEPGVDANAADAYRPLVENHRAVIDGLVQEALAKALRAPAEPLAPPAAQALERSRADLAKLGEATRARRATWPIAYEKSFEAELPSMSGARVLAQLAILEGHERASAGDVAGAAERYLEVLRFGSDFGNGMLLTTLIGAAIEKMAAEALVQLVRSPRGAPVLDAIDAGVTRLEPGLIEIGPAWRTERLLVAALGPIDDRVQFSNLVGALGTGVPRVLPQLMPWNAHAAEAVTELNRTYRDLEAAAPSRDALKKLEEEFLPRHYFATSNFLYRAMIPGVARAHLAVAEARLLVGAVHVATALERRRVADGRYPADPGPLPADSLARADQPLRYRAAAGGASYLLYSVGWDREDGGGKSPADVVLPDAGWPGSPGR